MVWNPFRRKNDFKVGPVYSVGNAVQRYDFTDLGNTTYSIEEFVQEISTRPFSWTFRNSTDEVAAYELAAGIFLRHVGNRLGFGHQVTLDSPASVDAFISNTVEGLFRRETHFAFQNHDKIDRLFKAACAGQLRREVQRPENRVPDIKARSREETLQKLGEWLMSKSVSLAGGVRPDEIRAREREDVASAVRAITEQGRYDLISVEGLDSLFFAAGPTGAVIRGAERTQAGPNEYHGGQALGRYFQRKIIRQAGHLRFRAITKNEYWLDLACYLLGASIIAHAYPDGNHRTSSMAYCCAYMGMVPPKYISKSWPEKELILPNVDYLHHKLAQVHGRR